MYRWDVIIAFIALLVPEKKCVMCNVTTGHLVWFLLHECVDTNRIKCKNVD